MQSLRRTARHARILALATAFITLVVVPACGGLSSDCSDYCDRFHDCVDSNLNVDKCEDACHDWADGNSDRESKVDSCSECLSQNDACSEATKRCFSDCALIPTK